MPPKGSRKDPNAPGGFYIPAPTPSGSGTSTPLPGTIGAAVAAAGSGRSRPRNEPLKDADGNEVQPLLRFTSFHVIGFLNGKNVAANFSKTDSQTFWSRRPTDEAIESIREQKRRRLMASEEELIAAKRRMKGLEERDEMFSRVEEEDEGDEGGEDVRINVLKSGEAIKPTPKSARDASSISKVAPSDPADEDAEDEDDPNDPMHKTIIIHPGSRFLRIGRASDPFPIEIPHVIATRSFKYQGPVWVGKGEGAEVNANGEEAGQGEKGESGEKGVEKKAEEGEVVVMSATGRPVRKATKNKKYDAGGDGDYDMDELASDVDEEDVEEDEEEPTKDTESADPIAMKITSIRGDLRARMRTFKLRGQGSGNAQAISYNETVRGEVTPEYNDPEEIEWNVPSGGKDGKGEEYYVGQKALTIPNPQKAGYTLKFPHDRGCFDTTGYSSPQEFMADLERIWLHALEGELGIPRGELKDYSAILIIPDLYDHIYVREMTDFILRGIGFKQLCLQQESICATFGAGLSTACVIDIGAKKTAITCVEDGLVLPETRMLLDFAGDDITSWLFTLLNRTAFPYKEANLALWHDWKILNDLKEKLIVLSEADIGLNVYDFYVRKYKTPTKKYSLRVYDDCILAPYTLFAPRVVEFDKKSPPVNHLWSQEIEDVYDIGAGTVTNAMRGSTRHLMPIAAPAIVAPDPTPGSPAVPHNNADGTPARSLGTTPAPDELLSVLPPLPAGASTATGSPITGADGADAAGGDKPAQNAKAASPVKEGPTIDIKLEASKIPLDVAVVESILACGAEERMRKVSQNILIVGGTGVIHNIGFAVESRVAPQLAARIPSLSNQTGIVPSPSGIDPRILAWKGIAVISQLDSSNDLWIRREDWDALGLRAVKDRCFFLA